MRNFIYLCLLAGPFAFCQNYSVDEINPELIPNADAVVRDYERHVEIRDIDEVVVTIKRVVTIYNEEGEDFLNAYEYYDEGDKIREQEAYVYDAAGKEIEHFKERDFKDQSAYASYVLFSDNRISYLDYTPRSYPYTIAYLSEVETSTTVFIGDWYPLEGYDVSVEKSKFVLSNPENIPIRFAERNFETFKIAKESAGSEISYTATNIPAWEYEKYTPDFDSFAPHTMVALDRFMLKGVEGQASTWKEFGKWMYDNLVADHDELPAETVAKINSLTKDAQTTEEKVRRIYQYVQDNTRYIMVAYGIGGWEPATAREVAQLGYGDCKALSNYTMALLKSQGIDAYYTVIYGDEDREDIDPDFTKMQGNHVILNVPIDSSQVWLECTSQTTAFNYQGDFTDDRFALRLSPEGGEIVRTRHYSEEDNLQKSFCQLQLNAEGDFAAMYSRKSYGVPYGDIYPIENIPEKRQKKYYREKWSQLQNISFQKIGFENNRKDIEFSEELEFTGTGLATKAGNRMLIPLSFIQQGIISVDKSEKRIRPLMIRRGKTFRDEFIYNLPEKFDIEALPESQTITSEFGEFSIEISKNVQEGNHQIRVNRTLVLKEGEWPAPEYQKFCDFISKMNRLNNLKAVIVSTNKA